jgi:hypothetical protein
MKKMAITVAASFMCAAVLGTGTAHAAGERAGVLPITLPEGSTVSSKKTEGWEDWQTPTSLAHNIRILLPQLPVGKPFMGVPWCASARDRDGTQQWDWASGIPGSTSIVVIANADSEIILYRGSTVGGELCD